MHDADDARSEDFFLYAAQQLRHSLDEVDRIPTEDDEDEEGGAPVREPRPSIPPSLSGGAALDEPVTDER